jgi:hypothetical protein
MNRKQYAAATLLIASLVAGTLAVGQKMLPAQSNRPSQPNSQSQIYSAPEHIVYGMLLHHAFVLNRAAEKAERQGKYDSALAYRSAFKSDAALNDEQARILDDVAAECEQAVAEQDAKAKVIIAARRAHYQQTGEVLPPSEELKAMQEERDAIILRYRDKLRAALGEQEWGRFSEFVARRVAPTVTVSPASPRNPNAASELPR